MRAKSAGFSCWTLTEETPAWSTQATISLRKLLRERPPGYTFTFWDRLDEKEGYRSMKLLPKRDERYYVIGQSLDDVAGYAQVTLIGATGSPMPVTTLRQHLRPSPDLDTLEQSLAMAPAYEDYRGRGPVGTIDMIELFLVGQGLGSKLLEHIMHDDYELLEALVMTERNARFFSQHGFCRSYRNDLDEVVMAWHNPAYR